MLDVVRRWTAAVRASRLRLTMVWLGLLLVIAVPAQALVRHSANRRSGAPAATAPGAPKCSFASYDPSADAPDLKRSQADNLDLVQTTFGLDKTDKKLLVVMSFRNLSKNIPSPADNLDYQVWWVNPSGDTSTNNAVDVTVNSSGTVAFTDGNVMTTGSNSVYTASKTSAATGTFGSGKGGKIKISVPLTEMGLKPGEVLTSPVAGTYDGFTSPAASYSQGADSDPGNNYTLDKKTCIDTTG